MSPALAAARLIPAAERQIRVMIVDDAVVARSMMTRWVEAEPDMKLVAALRSGREALESIEAESPDVVLLDVDMPELDGIAALPLLLSKKRDLVVIMVSTLTRRSAELSLRALALGATDYIPKPETTYEAMTSAAFRRELIDKIRWLGRKRLPLREPSPTPLRELPPQPSSRPPAAGRVAPPQAGRQHKDAEIHLRSHLSWKSSPRRLIVRRH
jgi:two-component system, chemotaxis family, protein-glutamate methylesterase/glutaminase